MSILIIISYIIIHIYIYALGLHRKKTKKQTTALPGVQHGVESALNLGKDVGLAGRIFADGYVPSDRISFIICRTEIAQTDRHLYIFHITIIMYPKLWKMYLYVMTPHMTT